MILFVEIQSAKKFLELIIQYSKVTGYKVIQKSITFYILAINSLILKLKSIPLTRAPLQKKNT